jgi:hypothetical protein
MPRYRFQWENLPPSVLRRLRDELDLGRGQPARLLHGAYGARPSADFVRSAWPVLRDSWLARDAGSRRSVVEDLRARRLGEWESESPSASAQVAYLRSCRNTGTLRDVVLSHLIAAGERSEPAKPAATRPVALDSAGPAPTPAGGSPEGAWKAFEVSLAGCLAQLSERQYLILLVRRHLNYFVQFAVSEGDLGAEVVSDYFLEPWERLGGEGTGQLTGLGWTPPAYDPGDAPAEPKGSPNFLRVWSAPVDCADAAKAAVGVLTTVLDVSHPGHLTYKAFERGGADIVFPSLGLRREVDEPKTVEPSEPEVASVEKLRTLVDDALARASGAETVDHDKDGDVPLRFGSTMVFVRVNAEQPIIEVFAPVVWDIPPTFAVLGSVNELNQHVRFLRYVATETGVDLRGELRGVPFDDAALADLVNAVGTMADQQTAAFQERFGGRVWFGTAVPSKESDVAGAGYL